jgi:hypothetical protein
MAVHFHLTFPTMLQTHYRPMLLCLHELILCLGELRRAGIDENLLMDLNDLGYTFDEIADYLDRVESQVTD